MLPALCLTSHSVGAESATQTSDVPVLSPTEARNLVVATSEVLLKQQSTLQLMLDCAGMFMHLSKSTDNAVDDWKKRHHSIVNKAQQLQDWVYQNLAQRDAPFIAEELILKVEQEINLKIKQLQDELKQKDRKQRHYLCNRLILSVASGDKDMIKVIPDHYHTVLEYRINQ